MKKSFVVVFGFLFFLSWGVSCGPKKETAPSGADILVLTQPAGNVPGNISAIDTVTGTVYDDLLEGGTGEMPNEFQLRGSTLWIVNSAQGSVQLVNVSVKDGKLFLSTSGRIYLPSESWPEYMAFLGDKAYVTLNANHSIGVINMVENRYKGQISLPLLQGCTIPGQFPYTFTGLAPWGVSVSGTIILVAGSGVSPGVIAGIETDTASTAFTVLTSKANANSISVASDRIFVTTTDACGSGEGGLDIFSISGQMLTTVSIGAPLAGIAITGNKAYIGSQAGPNIYIVDTNTYIVKANPLKLTSNTAIWFVTGVRISPKGLVYACGWGMEGGEVYEIDSATDTVKKIYAIKGPAQDISFRK